MLIPSKISRPIASAHVVSRMRLLEKLEKESNAALILLQSPAGFGKTTLISQWVKTLDHLGWYALDESDNQTEHFASYFIAAIMQATQGRCSKTEALVNKHHYASLNALFSALCVELADINDRIYVVLDDYHLIHNEEIHGAMRFFLRHQPVNLTLVMLTRSAPPIGIAKLRVKGRLLELTHAQLAFTPEECHAFFQHQFNVKLDESSTHKLCYSINGWPTALQLIAIQVNNAQVNKEGLTIFLGNLLVNNTLNENHLAEYLYEEVFEPLPDDVKRFLMCTSFLRFMSNDLCKRLMSISFDLYQREIELCDSLSDKTQDVTLTLEWLEQQGLFIYRKAALNELENHQIDGHLSRSHSQTWFGFHPLFASFLQKNALEQMATLVPTLHVIAAQYWLDIEVPSEAIYHAQHANQPDLLINIMQKYAWDFFHQSKLALLDSCFQALSDSQLIYHSELVLLKAWLAQSQHRHDTVEVLLNEADVQRLKLGIQLDKQAEGCIDALRAQLAINLGQVQLARKFAHNALSKLDIEISSGPEEFGLLSLLTFSRIVAHSVIGEVYHCEGQLIAALQSMQETVVLARRHQAHHYVLWAMIQQSEILMAQGHLSMAYEQQTLGFEYIHEYHLEQLPLHEFLLRIRAQLLLSIGKVDEAEAAARQGLVVLSHYQPQKQLQCLAILARCGLVRGAINHAQSILQRCESLVQSDFYHQDWVHNVDKARVIYWQLTQNEIAASNWLLNQHPAGGAAGNHFTQGQSQNIVRAMILTKRFTDAQQILVELINFASRNQLISDLNRNFILQAVFFVKQDKMDEAVKSLIQALELGSKTGFRSEFLIEGEHFLKLLTYLLKPQILHQQLIGKEALALAVSFKNQLEEIYSPDVVLFDESLIEVILNHPAVPAVLLASPLTLREWQVLGLIYSGLSNDDICHQIEVAMTTLKTHIRNIYQKISVSHRAEAIKFTEELLKLV